MVKVELDITIQEFASLQKKLDFPIRITSVPTFKQIKALKNKGEFIFEQHIKTIPLTLDVEIIQYIYNFLFDKKRFNILEHNREQQRSLLE